VYGFHKIEEIEEGEFQQDIP